MEKTIEIPARSVMLLTAKVAAKPGMPITDLEGLLEPMETPGMPKHLLIARSLSHVSNECDVTCQVVNVGPESVKLHKGTRIAQFTQRANVFFLETTETAIHPEGADLMTADVQANQWAADIDLSQTDLEERQKCELLHVLKEFSDVFATQNGPLGRTSLVKHAVSTEGPPIRQPLRRLPVALKDVVQDEVNKMLQQGVVQPSKSPWSSPVVMVMKKDGSWRFCVDFRKVNAVTHKDAYPLPRIDATLESLSGCQYFTTLDLASGYWQVELEEGDKEKTAFSTPDGHFEFNVMPFGLTNAPATFQRLMQCVLAGMTMEQCLVYLDDIIVFAPTFHEHLRRLREVLQRLSNAGLKVKVSKCQFAQREVRYLGHIVSAEGIRPDPAKLDAVVTYPVPKDVGELRRFLGLANYYRRYVKDYSQTAEPLHKLTRKTASGFQWNEICQQAFELLKEHLVSPPILAYPQFDRPFILYTDASEGAIGAVLSQMEDGRERVIAY